jgi:RHS repeat-associated protein
MSYNPNIGRWISEDPIGFQAADPNLFRYVGNSPTNAVDPDGLLE